jgi:FhaA, N-terminal domain/FHA domain
MNLLKSVETTIASLVEGAFGRMFRSEVRPMEIARKLAREMDAHRTVSVSRVYVPNEYSVWLSPEDRERYEGVEHEVIDELCAYLLEHARREDLIMASHPQVDFHTDQDLALGEFGIQARLVRHDDHSDGHAAARAAPGDAPGAAPGAAPEDEHGQTMIYSTSARLRGPVRETQPRRAPRALLQVGSQRLLVPPGGGVIGRSRDCDVVLDDSGVSRRHAELRPQGSGWTIADLDSTNGVLVNGSPLAGAQQLAAGDRIELGSTEIVFELG